VGQRNKHVALEDLRLGAVIRVDDEAGNVIETHRQAGEFREW
jgi:hypothetical protein